MEKYFDINESGCSIRCKIYCINMREIRSVVVYGHGFCGHKDNNVAAKFATALLKKHKDSALLAFDWPCHGEDGRKKLVLDECFEYLSLVIDYAKRELHAEKLYMYATSFGGYLTLKYIHDNGTPFGKIILRCPAVNMYDVLLASVMKEDEIAKVMKGKDVEVGFDRKIKISREFLEQLKDADISDLDFIDFAEDILIIHGTKDELVSFDFVRDFADRNIIEFVPIENADHRFMNPTLLELANQYIFDFLEL